MAVYNAYDCNPASNAPNYANLGFVTGANMCGFPAVTITGFNNNNPVLAGESGSSARSGIYRWLDSAPTPTATIYTSSGARYLLTVGW